MKLIFITICTLLFCIIGIAQEKTAQEFQNETDEHYASPTKSPLLKKDLETFKGLPWFEIDSAFIVVAQLKKTPNSASFIMETTTSRKSLYSVYAIAKFKLNGKKYDLNIYQSKGNKNPALKNYLFLPFNDYTNGNQTYGGGRFIDLIIPEGDEIIIDFNKAYNPYCAYNHGYSCPIPPKENKLKVEILAGVKYKEKE